MKSQILDHLKDVISRDKKKFGKLVNYDGQNGFSEDAMQGLKDLEARTPPPDAIIEPAYTPGYVNRDRLSPRNAAGGDLVKGDDGAKRPHYWGHRERLRQRFLKGGHEPMPEYELLELLVFTRHKPSSSDKTGKTMLVLLKANFLFTRHDDTRL
ncbi:hypothetical protein [Ruegeria atlantica]|uniref:hypothetical protein n=1 Tax=Ruegeria atlantica TaxID=81569 RepID=UPI00349FE5B0